MSTSSNSASGGATGGWANAQPSAIDGNVPDVVWYRPGFMESASLYTRMVEIFSNDVEILRMLLLSMKPREVEEYAQCIVSIFTSTGRILPLIKSLLRHEFESRALSLHKSDMLRGSSAASKISGYYVRNIGGEYLQVLLGDLISEIVLNPDLDLEIQPTKFVSFYNRRNIDEEELEQKLEENRQRLMETAQIFIERIIDREFFTIIPRELRAIAAYTSQLAQEYSPGQVIPLVGGFVILRFLSPAIVTPESYNILPADVIPTPKARRNLVLLAKLLQNCSNGILYGAKEIYMTCMNDFVLRNGPSISQFLEVLIKDPLSPENAIGSRPFSDLDQTAPLQFKIQQIDIADLFTLHSLVYIFKDKLKMVVEEGTIEVQRNSLGNSNEGQNASHSPNNSGTSSSVLSSSSSTSLSPPSHASVLSPSIRIGRRVNTPNNLSVSGSSSSSSSTSSTSSSSSSSTTSASSGVPLTPLSLSDDKKSEILKFLVDLGPSPYITDKNRLAANHCYRRSKQVDLRDAEHLPMNYESMMGFGGVGGFGGGLESMTDQHTNSLEKGGFLYVGPNTKSGHPVLYIIVNRFRSEYMQNVDVLISYIHKVMLAIGDMRYVVVIDMSWANISKEMKRDVYQQLMKLGNIFDYTFRKNLERVYIVHPSAYTRAVILFMRSFTSNKLKSKIVEVFNWESLTNEIAPEDIALPETSKDFITKSYNVIKVNSKGKSQKRLIKFTPVSLLNIDPKTRRIQNEKKLSDIIQLGTFFSLDEIHIKFENHRESKKSFLGVQWKTEGDSSFRRYKILTRQDRDEIIEDVFRIGFQYGPVPLLPQEYRVTKVNKRGRHQERTFKFTCDSLLNIDNNSIKSEISFAGIENVEQDTHDPHVIWLQFKMESSRRKIICKDSTNLILALKEGMERYRQEDALALQREIYSDPSDDDQ